MEMFLFRKHLRNESVFEMKVKLFYFLKHQRSWIKYEPLI